MRSLRACSKPPVIVYGSFFRCQTAPWKYSYMLGGMVSLCSLTMCLRTISEYRKRSPQMRQCHWSRAKMYGRHSELFGSSLGSGILIINRGRVPCVTLRLCNEVHKPLVSPRPGSLRRKPELQLGHLRRRHSSVYAESRSRYFGRAILSPQTPTVGQGNAIIAFITDAMLCPSISLDNRAPLLRAWPCRCLTTSH